MKRSYTILEGKKLTVGYSGKEKDNILLSEIDLSASSNELIAIIGLNGSGKSSLLRSLLKLENFLSGDIDLFGRNFTSYSSGELARKVAFVSTDWLNAMNMKVNELVSLGRFPYTNIFGTLSPEDHLIVDQSISKMKLNTLAGRKMSEISDGEKQRTMIARALAQDTDLIFLDEPTAFLDIPNKYNIVSYLRELCNEGKTIIFSTHDFQLANRFADRFWMIHDQKIIDGSPEDLVLNGVINESFKSEKLTFDMDVGDFMPLYPKENEIGLKFENRHNVHAWWTHRALRRIGYKTALSNEKPDMSIQIREEKGKIIWNLQKENQNLLFTSILELINHLKNLNHEFS